jgi:DNA mismatch repair protein MSH2
LIQLGVKECILQEDQKSVNHELAKLKTLIERCGVIVTERKAGELSLSSTRGQQAHSLEADFVTKNVEQDLTRLLSDSHSAAALRESTFRTGSRRC